MTDPAALLETLVGIPSVSGSEQALADHLEGLLAGWDFRVRRLGANLYFELGTRGPRLLLLGHLDTVQPCKGWSADPFSPWWAHERLFGLGVNCAKGCVAALVLAALALRDRDFGGRAVFAFTCEEETSGDGARELVPLLGPLDAALVAEPTGLTVCTAQRGLLLLQCRARGESAHVAHAHLGENAVHKAARDIARLDVLRFEPHLLLGETRAQVIQVQSGMALTQVPDLCEFMVDVRSTPNLDHAALAARITAELESDVTVLSDHYPPMATDPREAIVRAALAAAGTQGGTGSATASDWACLGSLPAVKAGPGDTYRSHRPDEWLSLSELQAGAAFYEKLVLNYARMASRENPHG